MIELLLGRQADFRRAVFQRVLLITSATIAFFSIYNWAIGQLMLALVECFLLLGWLLIYRISHHSNRLGLWSSIYLLSCFALVVTGLLLAQFSAGLFVWFLIFPVLSYLLLGSVRGKRLTIVFTLTTIVIMAMVVHRNPDALWIAFANTVLCMAALWAVAHVYEHRRETIFSDLSDLALRDPLTGLYNRLMMRAIFDNLARDKSTKTAGFSILIMDIDHFKQINDNNGHDIGDGVLQALAEILADIDGQGEWSFRIGGEEFCLFLPHRPYQGSLEQAEQLRESIASFRRAGPDGQELPSITVSMGIAQWPRDGLDLSSLLKVADERLYQAKNNGRNCVVGLPGPDWRSLSPVAAGERHYREQTGTRQDTSTPPWA